MLVNVAVLFPNDKWISVCNSTKLICIYIYNIKTDSTLQELRASFKIGKILLKKAPTFMDTHVLVTFCVFFFVFLFAF